MAEKKVIRDFSNKSLDNNTPDSSDEELVDVFLPMEASEARKRGHKVVYRRIGIIKYSGIITKGTKEFAEKYARMLDNESRASIRESRCHIADGRGGFIMCPECNSCRNCKKKESLNFTKNHPLSLDQLTTAESEDDKVMDIQDNHCDVVSDTIALTMLDELLSYLGTFENKPYSLIFQMLYDQSTIQEIAEALNKPCSTVNDTVKKVCKLVQEYYKMSK